MIIYGGTPQQIDTQKECPHEWHGPCMDTVGRYFKCLKCLCLDREDDPEDLPGTCFSCGGPTYIVRPGKSQCNTCDFRFCRNCGRHHLHLTDDCQTYGDLLAKFDYDERLLNKAYEAYEE